MNTSNSSRVMHMAHKLLQFYPTMSWSEIMKLAWRFLYLRQMLQRGIVKFSYYKTTEIILMRVIRPARGTLNLELIPKEFHPKDSPTYEPNYSTMSYFDLDVMGWRSFRLDCLRDIEGYITLNAVSLDED